MKQGLKEFCKHAENAISSELQQLYLRDAFTPINHKSLTRQQFFEVLKSHLFLKEKCDKSVKGRMVAGGNKQRATTLKAEVTSPAAAIESVILTATIDAKEGRDVAVVDIPNAFIQTDCHG